MIEITPTQCHDITRRMCAAYLRGEAGEYVTAPEFAAMQPDEIDAYHMGGQARRRVMEGVV